MANEPSLVEYPVDSGKWMGAAEVLLFKLFEEKHKADVLEERAKQMEREIMAQRSRSLQPVNHK